MTAKVNLKRSEAQRPSVAHYALSASVIVLICMGTRLLLSSGVLLFSRQTFNRIKRNYIVSCFCSF